MPSVDSHSVRDNLFREVGTGKPARKRISPFRLAVSAAAFLVLGVVWALFMRGTFRATEVGSGSMEPTIQVGDRLIVVNSSSDDLERGEIVTLESPDDEGSDLVKRIVAIPGDRISWRNGVFHVNGEPSPPPGLDPYLDSDNADFFYRLPEDHYFVLGDNREKSYDSEEFGPVARELINGNVVFRYSPFDRFGAVD